MTGQIDIQTSELTSPAKGLEWQVTGQSLRFTLSDYTVCEYGFRALVAEPPVTVLLETPEPPLPPSESQDSSVVAAVIRNYPVTSPLSTFQRVGPWVRYVPDGYTRFLVEKNGTFEQYLEKFSSKSRNTVRRKVKKFDQAAGGSCCFREYRTPAEASEFHKLATVVSDKTYQNRLFNEGLVLNEETRQRINGLAEKGSLRGYLLSLRDEPVAFALCEAKADVLLYKTVGYAPEHRDLSPGTVLLWHILKRFHESSESRYLDFGEGEDTYKEFFANRTFECARVYYFKRKPLALVAVLAHRSWHLAVNAARQAPGVPRLIAAFRRLLRRRATGTVQPTTE